MSKDNFVPSDSHLALRAQFKSYLPCIDRCIALINSFNF